MSGVQDLPDCPPKHTSATDFTIGSERSSTPGQITYFADKQNNNLVEGFKSESL